MGAIWLTAVAVVVGGAFAGWRRRLFPGGWAFALASRFAAERRELARARTRVRGLEGAARADESAARAELAEQEQRHRNEVRTRERLIATLNNPGTGRRLGSLGEMTLNEHVVVARDAKSVRHTLQLTGLGVEFDWGEENYYVYLVRTDGRRVRVDYPRTGVSSEEPEQKQRQETRYTEKQVRDFADVVRDAVAQENTFRARLPQRLKETEAELDRVREDTAAQERARERLARIQARNKDNPHLRDAREELEAERRKWRALTGKMPPA
ncbi:hypothetical protein [Streptomyces sp. NPDC047024]|uniref:hypothetical protein n=1 Tax=Streptomyces sp. NPDC047024 TaxID=3155476 RepID=UPI0033F94F89